MNYINLKYCIVNNTVLLFNPTAPAKSNNIFLQNARALCFLLELETLEKEWITHRSLEQLNTKINEMCNRFYFEAGE
jgi:hypothetical protein